MTTDLVRINDLNEQCFDWRSPEELIALADRLSEALGNDAIFRRGRTFREAFIAGRFALRRGAQRVRLLKEQSKTSTPDFELDVNGQFLTFETTEADVPGRRRQDEYRSPALVEPVVFTSLGVMVDQMRKLAARKASKAYVNCHGLVLFVNPPAFFFEPQMRWQYLVHGAEPAAKAFKEVWAMRDRGALLWLNGKPQNEVTGEDF